MKLLRVILKPVTALAGSIDHAVERKIALSVARHLLTALGGVLVAKGYLDASAVQDVVGAGLVIVGALAGAQQKRTAA